MPSVNLGKQHPASYKTLGALSAQADTAVRESGLDPLLAELVRIRVSQLNGCAFCLRMHTRDAPAKGESTDRLAVLAAWWESQYFSAQEPRGPCPGRTGHQTDRPGAANLGRRLADRRAGLRSQLARYRHERLEPGRHQQPLPGRPLSR
jgi:AhpD family alkylhydroperoxidase